MITENKPYFAHMYAGDLDRSVAHAVNDTLSQNLMLVSPVAQAGGQGVRRPFYSKDFLEWLQRLLANTGNNRRVALPYAPEDCIILDAERRSVDTTTVAQMAWRMQREVLYIIPVWCFNCRQVTQHENYLMGFVAVGISEHTRRKRIIHFSPHTSGIPELPLISEAIFKELKTSIPDLDMTMATVSNPYIEELYGVSARVYAASGHVLWTMFFMTILALVAQHEGTVDTLEDTCTSISEFCRSTRMQQHIFPRFMNLVTQPSPWRENARAQFEFFPDQRAPPLPYQPLPHYSPAQSDSDADSVPGTPRGQRIRMAPEDDMPGVDSPAPNPSPVYSPGGPWRAARLPVPTHAVENTEENIWGRSPSDSPVRIQSDDDGEKTPLLKSNPFSTPPRSSRSVSSFHSLHEPRDWRSPSNDDNETTPPRQIKKPRTENKFNLIDGS